MPQMSPMLWVIFPLFMMGLIVVGIVILEFESVIGKAENCLFNEGDEMIKW
uniref:ATP synthase F0 subunit 8 n=1 Tax=Brachypelma albiceps TaxID=1750704 RepID=UPI001FF0FDD0|nr:ATP synthase F0 subunit 8 [Brachypelma albiceps]UIO59245.1 ATP synthase F0 subunit 8 [Brachypelma albiceps]